MPDHDRTRSRDTLVLAVRGLRWATEQNVVSAVLRRRPGVVDVEPNPVAQTATVTFDPARTSVTELRDWVRDCGYHCAGQSVPGHLCDPMREPGQPDHEDQERAGHVPAGHAGRSMAAMVADMRNRFLVAVLFSIPIVLWSPIGAAVFGYIFRCHSTGGPMCGRCC